MLVGRTVGGLDRGALLTTSLEQTTAPVTRDVTTRLGFGDPALSRLASRCDTVCDVKGDDLVDGPLLPLLARGVLLALGAGIVTAAFGPAVALGPSLTLLVVVAVAAIPLPGTTARVLQAFAEITVLALVIGSVADTGLAFLPLLLLPVFAAGQRGGLALGAAGGLTAGLAWCLAIMSTTTPSLLLSRLDEPLLWTVLLVATGLIGGWVRRLTLQTRTFSDSAYSDAFRLLSELQQVAHNLSLGLDPATLAASLVDEVGTLDPASRRTVSVRTGEGRPAALVGSGTAGQEHIPAANDRSPQDSAWTSGRHVAHVDTDGRQHHAFPVRMGEEVVAVLDVQATSLSPTTVAAIEGMVSETGPKLAAALMFDDVRRLATVDERLRLAREIHDGVAQELASVGYMLDDLADRVPDDAAAEVRSLRTHVRSVVGELRLSIFDLRAGVDDTIGLGTALTEHVQRVGQQSDLVVHTVLDEHGDRLPTGTEVELLRIAQEAVTNVRKHAQASNMWVECTVDAPKAWLRIADDGIGMQPARPQSMGLQGMRERTRRIGGDLQMSERPGGGTVVEVSIGDWDEEMDS